MVKELEGVYPIEDIKKKLAKLKDKLPKEEPKKSSKKKKKSKEPA